MAYLGDPTTEKIPASDIAKTGKVSPVEGSISERLFDPNQEVRKGLVDPTSSGDSSGEEIRKEEIIVADTPDRTTGEQPLHSVNVIGYPLPNTPRSSSDSETGGLAQEILSEKVSGKPLE